MAEEPRRTEPAPGRDPGKEARADAGLPIVPALDGFRAYAILGIVLFHLLGSTSAVTIDGTRHAVYAVLPSLIEVLFIISGFVVFLPTVARRGEFGSVGAYALRRGARLLPAYWLALVVVLVSIALWPGVAMPSISSIGIHGAMAQVPVSLIDPGLLIGFGINGPLWTLSLEVTFYLVLPLVAAWYFRHPLVGLGIAAALTVAWKAAIINLGEIAAFFGVRPTAGEVQQTGLMADNQFPAFALSFALGMTAAWAYVRLRDRYPPELVARPAIWMQGASLAVIGVCAYLFGRYAITSESLFPVHLARRDIPLSLLFPTAIAVFMVATALAPRRFQYPFALRSSRALGDISYGIYLIHLPILVLVAGVLSPLAGAVGEFWVLLAVAIPLTIAYGWASAHFVEQPIRRWAHRFGRRSQATTGGTLAEVGDAAQVGLTARVPPSV